MTVFWGLMIPFLGTSLGAACVFFMKKDLKPLVQKGFLGFASGVMVAASVWSLLIPAMEMSQKMKKFAFIPAAAGFFLGIGFLLLMDRAVPHLHMGSEKAEGPKTQLKKTTMLVLAVTLHNIPEGLSAGAVFAGVLSGNESVTMAGAVALCAGIAIQNFPEGAVISLPLRGEGTGRGKAFFYGVLSGVVEPLAGGLTLVFARYVNPALPYLLSFAAGAMIYVVVEELIPEANEGEHSNVGTVTFAVGFVVMMTLDVVFG